MCPEPQSGDRLTFEVELDQHDGFVALDPGIVARFDGDDGRCLVVEGRPVCVLADEVAPSQEADVRVFAELGTDMGLDVSRPSSAGGVDETLDARVADLADIDLHPGKVVAFGTVYRSEQWVFFHARVLHVQRQRWRAVTWPKGWGICYQLP